MHRVKIMGLALVAALTVGAMSASGAQAGLFGSCVKAPKEGKIYKGQYLDKNCTKEATEEEQEKGGKTNKYNFEVGQNAENEKYTVTTKTMTLNTPGVAAVICKKGAGSGQRSGAVNGQQVILFEDCLAEGRRCNSTGQPSGVISWASSDETWDNPEKTLHGHEPAPGEAWWALENGSYNEITEQGWQAEFNCEGITVVVRGAVSGVILPVNVNGKKVTVDFGEGKGANELETELVGLTPFLPSVFTTDMTVKDTGKFEFNTDY
jgi:hypothetical protein